MALVGYDDIAEALRVKLVTYFADELNSDRCRVGELDQLFGSLMEENADYGCIIDFFRARKKNRAPFKEMMWSWQMMGVFMIRFRDKEQIEIATRKIITKLSTVFKDDHTLGRLVPLVEMAYIDKPSVESVNDIPFHWVPFLIEVWDKS
jgi:hypothetical protein